MGRIIQTAEGFEIFDKSGKSLTFTIPDYRTAKIVNQSFIRLDRLNKRKLNQRTQAARAENTI